MSWELGVLMLCSLHILLSLFFLGLLIMLLVRELKRTENLPAHTLGQPTADAWYFNFMYITLVVLFHLGFALYMLVTTIQDPPTNHSSVIDSGVLVWYLLSYTMRWQPNFLFVPNLIEVCSSTILRYTWGSPQIRLEQLRRERGSKRIASGLLVASFEIPMMISVMWNTSLFYFTSATCTSYLFCLFTWDHWFQAAAVFSSAYFYLREYWENKPFQYFILLVLAGFGSVIAAIPFLTFSMIAPLTVMTSIYYEILNVAVAWFLLSTHYKVEPDPLV
jgi:hypothetical protein